MKLREGGVDLHTKLTLQEKLRDLRDERKLKLSDVEQETGISVPTLSRFETDEYTSIAYQDLLKLATFYGVSMDYLSGMTNHRQYQNIFIDELALTDEVIALLKSKRANNRLISELLTQEEFIKLLATIEIYIDGKISAGSNVLNATIQVAENAILKEVDLQDKDELLAELREAFIDENACLRYRITERFSTVIQGLFEQHKHHVDGEAETLIADKMEECLDTYFDSKRTNDTPYLKLAIKQLGIDISDFSDEETAVLEKCLSRSKFAKAAPLNNRSLKHYKKRKPMK